VQKIEVRDLEWLAMIKALVQKPVIVFLIASLLIMGSAVSAWLLPVKLQPMVSESYIVVNAVTEKEMDLEVIEQQISIPLENIALNSDING
jgi:multidrug efflux pump subunit AcrB